MSEQSLDYTNGDKYEVRLECSDELSLMLSIGFSRPEDAHPLNVSFCRE